jgi:hypothetical protein
MLRANVTEIEGDRPTPMRQTKLRHPRMRTGGKEDMAAWVDHLSCRRRIMAVMGRTMAHERDDLHSHAHRTMIDKNSHKHQCRSRRADLQRAKIEATVIVGVESEDLS